MRAETPTAPGILYVDQHLIHEVTSPQAFAVLHQREIPVARPDRTTGVIDHSTPTLPPAPDGSRAYVTEAAKKQVETFIENCRRHGIKCHDWESEARGIVHVAAPEIGLSQPGATIVCGDSHTSTHGAFGALAFGIGTTEVSHVLATQCLFQRKSKSFSIDVRGALANGIGAKDLALAILAKVGASGGAGHVIEYRGPAVRRLGMEGRMTLCNMSIEAGARAGLIAPDETTFAWLEGRAHAPTRGGPWERALETWRKFFTDADAAFDTSETIDANAIRPMATYGVNPATGIAIDAPTPAPTSKAERDAFDYMRLEPGKPLLGAAVGTVFIGSCTNSRLSDLREAAAIMRGRKIASGVRALVVPGSNMVKRQAEEEGLHEVFIRAGAEWREPGCSMCIAMNGDVAGTEGLTVSTSNRNFLGRQGPGARTILCGPSLAAASAVKGAIADPRRFAEASS